jgi:hypothetical protein
MACLWYKAGKPFPAPNPTNEVRMSFITNREPFLLQIPLFFQTNLGECVSAIDAALVAAKANDFGQAAQAIEEVRLNSLAFLDAKVEPLAVESDISKGMLVARLGSLLDALRQNLADFKAQMTTGQGSAWMQSHSYQLMSMVRRQCNDLCAHQNLRVTKPLELVAE